MLFVDKTPGSKKRVKLSLPRATQGVPERLPVIGSTGESYCGINCPLKRGPQPPS
jgi:hypothetical protein